MMKMKQICRRTALMLMAGALAGAVGAQTSKEPETGIISQTGLGSLSAGNQRPQQGCCYPYAAANVAMTVRKVYPKNNAYRAAAVEGAKVEFMLLDTRFDAEMGAGEPPPTGLYQYIGMRDYPAEAGREGSRMRTFVRVGEKDEGKIRLAHERAVAALDPTRVSPAVAQERKVRAELIKSIIDNMLPVPGKPYRVGKTEVTEAQWDVIMKKTPSQIRTGALPATGLSWDDCQDYVTLLNLLPEVRNAGLKFRLPSVSEWCFVCRAGSRGRWGMLTVSEGGNLPDMGWFTDNSRNRKAPVAQKKPNVWGFYDMHGNVWEWCSDVSAQYGGDFRSRVGGSFKTPADNCAIGFVNSANRHFSNYDDQGLRLWADLR